MNKCPLFGRCGGCKFDFASPDYRAQKLGTLCDVPVTGDPVWVAPGGRRRADFCFADGRFGFFAPRSKDVVPVPQCPGASDEINRALPHIASMPWNGAGSALVTVCDNGIDIAITSNVPYFSADFKTAAAKLPDDIIRVTWNDAVVMQRAAPTVTFAGVTVPYPSGAFLQPGRAGEDALRQLVVDRARGARRVADLFCGLGNFTFALNADGFDIVGTGCKRDLYTHPVTVGMLRTYDCVVMDPPRGGAMAQCRELVKSDVSRIIYVSCNPTTFMRDRDILVRGGYRMTELIPVDQFVGSAHWELVGVFQK